MADTPAMARLSDEELVDLDRRIQFAPGETYALLLRALTELIERRAAGEWKDVNEHDGSKHPVDLWSTTRGRVPNCQCLNSSWWDDSYYTRRVTDATHYMPLPAPPTRENGG